MPSVQTGGTVTLRVSTAVAGSDQASAMKVSPIPGLTALTVQDALAEIKAATAANAASAAVNAAAKISRAGDAMSGPFYVQPVTAAGQPSRVTAVDNVTGRISINNIERGFTGVRDLTTLLAPDWQGDGSALFVERVGDDVRWYFNLVRASTLGPNDPAAAAGILSNVFAAGSGPAGFGAVPLWSFQGANDHLLHTHGATGDTLVRPVIARVVSSWIYIMVGPYSPDAFPFVRGQITVRAADFWPSTLPGSMVTPSFTLPNF